MLVGYLKKWYVLPFDLSLQALILRAYGTVYKGVSCLYCFRVLARHTEISTCARAMHLVRQAHIYTE